MGKKRLLIPALLLAVVTTLAAAERTKYYEVKGASVGELREALNNARPKTPDGQPHDAVTTWHVDWRYRYANTPDGCTVGSFDTSIETQSTMPKWINASDGDTALVERWNAYLKALVLHEDGHRALGPQAARTMQDGVAKLRSYRTCAELGDAIKQLCEGVLAEYRRKEQKYDADTQHGRTQGAHFP